MQRKDSTNRSLLPYEAPVLFPIQVTTMRTRTRILAIDLVFHLYLYSISNDLMRYRNLRLADFTCGQKFCQLLFFNHVLKHGKRSFLGDLIKDPTSRLLIRDIWEIRWHPCHIFPEATSKSWKIRNRNIIQRYQNLLWS